MCKYVGDVHHYSLLGLPQTASLFSYWAMSYCPNSEHYSWWWQQTLSFFFTLLVFALAKLWKLFLYESTNFINVFIIDDKSTWTLFLPFLSGVSFLMGSWFVGKSFLITYHCCGFVFHFTHYSKLRRLVSNLNISHQMSGVEWRWCWLCRADCNMKMEN